MTAPWENPEDEPLGPDAASVEHRVDPGRDASRTWGERVRIGEADPRTTYQCAPPGGSESGPRGR